MPTVSINLSDNAYKLYIEWKNDGRKASQRVSAAIMLWNAQVLEPQYMTASERKEAEE